MKLTEKDEERFSQEMSEHFGLKFILDTCMCCGEKFAPRNQEFLEDYELPTCENCQESSIN